MEPSLYQAASRHIFTLFSYIKYWTEKEELWGLAYIPDLFFDLYVAYDWMNMRGKKHNKNSICLIVIKGVLFPPPSKQKEKKKPHSLILLL